MNHLQATFPVSERRAARVVSVNRSTLRYEARLPEDEPRLLARMEMLVRKHPRYGYRRIGDLLGREGFRANPKSIYRLWKREGYRVARSAQETAPGCRRERLSPSPPGVPEPHLGPRLHLRPGRRRPFLEVALPGR